MFRFIACLLCIFAAFSAAAHNDSPHNAIYELTVEPSQSVQWLDTANLILPQGQPTLKKSAQRDLDKSIKISWEKTGNFTAQFIDKFTSESLRADFEPVHNKKAPPLWTQVKPAQFELNALSDIRHFSTRQGLPTGAVYKTIQDKTGALWLATNGEGLCHYIGDHFRCFNDSHGLINNRVWDIAKTNSNKLALATDKGLNLFDGHSFQVLKIDGKPFLDKVNNVEVINETLFFSTQNALYQYDNNLPKKLISYAHTEQIFNLTVNEQTLWIASSSGLLKLEQGKLSRYQFNNQCQGITTAVTRAKQHVYFALKSGQVCRLDKSTHSVDILSGIQTPNVTALMFDNKHETLWLGDDSWGVFKLRNNQAYNYNKQNGLSDKHIRGLMKDAQGHIWVSTYGGGINRIREAGFKLLSKRSGLLNERVSALTNINEQLWLGQYGTGVQILDNGEWLTPVASLFNRYIHSIAKDDQGRVWLGSRQGIIVLTQSKSTHIWHEQGLSADIVHQIIAAPDGCMYIATQSGLYRSCNGKLQFLKLARAEYVIDVFVDNVQRVWFVTNGGGTYFLANDIVYKFTESGGFPSNWAYSIEQDDNQIIYLGTRSGVLALKEDNSRWLGRHISQQEGLSSNIVLGLKYHQDALWIGTERGNNRLKTTQLFMPDAPLELDAFVYDNGYIAVDATLNTAALLENTFYWGSGSGLTYFNPDNFDINPNLKSTLLEVTSLGIGGNHSYPPLIHPQESNFQFSSDTLQITFKFSHNDWASPERVMYQTRLLGSSEIWSEPTSLSEITYNHLSPGDYEFQVRATARGQHGQPVSYSFTLLAPWWQTWPAYSIMLITALLCMYLAMKWQFNILATQQRVKDRAEFSEALLARKKQLLAEVSHEIRTPLSVLKMSIEGLEYNLLEDTEKTYELLHRRIGDINKLVADIDQLAMTELEERPLNRAYHPVKPWLVSWCNDAKDRVNQRPDSQFQFDIKLSDQLFMHADLDRLTQVLSNILSNSLRYSAAPATIQLRAYIKAGQLNISIRDSAPGVSDSELKDIFKRMYQSEQNKTLYKGGTGLGLAICQDLITRHGGIISANHSEIGGVRIKITLPILEV
ncbi:two-component regulator propeller domain-containing protein [Pseudoalteromonas umbrosa]|uniref:sensor histidine kinase n=1 Tax=Pseudoalteromonas umbrosa TaxID=3048489 RepID=UPI0024C4205D|nr:two-component regulator propeller domain-containing protein [Pseudoalteromonas sp. B95]MDK1287702.1 two-component regulator propeller domain-containing protein [Pseudoalteromonas sp. B95]